MYRENKNIELYLDNAYVITFDNTSTGQSVTWVCESKAAAEKRLAELERLRHVANADVLLVPFKVLGE